MSAKIDLRGKVTKQDRLASPEQQVDPTDVGSPVKLARLLTDLLKDVSTLKRKWWPRRIDFEDLAVEQYVDVTLPHNFGGRVRWWLVDWSGGNAVQLSTVSAVTTTKTLVLSPTASGTATIRVEEAG